MRRTLVRAQRAWRRNSLRAAVARRGVRLDGLPSSSRNLLVIAALAGLLLSGMLLLNAQHSDESPSLVVPNQLLRHTWPWSVVIGFLGGLLMMQLLVARLALTSTGRRAVPYALAAGVAGTAVLLITWRQCDLILSLYTDVPEIEGLSKALLVTCLVATSVGMVALVRGARRLGYLAMCSPLVIALAWLVATVRDTELEGSEDNRLPDTLHLASTIGGGVVLSGLSIAGAALAITLWQTVEAVRATRDAAGGAGALFARSIRAGNGRGNVDPWLVLAILLGAKLAWASAGIWGLLPDFLGRGLDVWDDIRVDGWLSWLLALAVGLGLVAWLEHGCPGPHSERGLLPPLVAVVAGLAFPEILFQGLAIGYAIGASAWFVEAANWVDSAQPVAPMIVVVLAALAAGYRWLTHRRDSGTLFLAVFSAWGLIRVPVLVRDFVEYPWYPWGLSMPSESTYGQHAGWVGGATIDLAVTVLLLIICLRASRGAQLRFVPVLVVALSTTIVVYPGMLTDIVLSATMGSALAFLLPFAYLYLLDAEALNRRDGGRERRLLGVAALSILALMVGLLRSYFGYTIAAQDLDLALAMLMMPVLVTTVVGMLAPRAPSVTHALGEPDGGGQSVSIDHQALDSE